MLIHKARHRKCKLNNGVRTSVISTLNIIIKIQNFFKIDHFEKACRN